jgi:hypothetical protein
MSVGRDHQVAALARGVVGFVARGIGRPSPTVFETLQADVGQISSG